jgi:hypothetical protein
VKIKMIEKSHEEKLQELKDNFCKNCSNPIPSDKCAHAVLTSANNNSELRCKSFNSINIFNQPKNEWGSTRLSKEFFEKYMNDIGDIFSISLEASDFSPLTKFIGTKGIINCYGFYWGYGGDGPSGLRWAISKILNLDYYGEKSQNLRSYISKLHMDCNHVISVASLT